LKKRGQKREGQKKDKKSYSSFLKKRGFLIFKLTILLILASVIAILINFDRFANHIPHRYKPVFEKINDVIFGKVQVIEIYGNSIVSKDEILTHIYKNEFSKDDLTLINPVHKIMKSLSENPVIENVNVKRFLPNRMVFYVKEKKIILKFYNEELKRFFSITESGEILDYYNPNVKMPLIIRKFAVADAVKVYNKIQEYENISPFVSDLISVFEYRFDVILNRKIIVNLPEENLEDALNVLQDLIIKNKILEKNIKQIDLRVKNKIFINYFKPNESQMFKLEDSVTILNFN
jgi:cell division protein FtsQ